MFGRYDQSFASACPCDCYVPVAAEYPTLGLLSADQLQTSFYLFCKAGRQGCISHCSVLRMRPTSCLNCKSLISAELAGWLRQPDCAALFCKLAGADWVSPALTVLQDNHLVWLRDAARVVSGRTRITGWSGSPNTAVTFNWSRLLSAVPFVPNYLSG